MDEKSGGLDSSARQRQTAAEIARQRVLNSYANSQKNSAYKQAPVNAEQAKADWKRYHSAWQNYYQKYYSDYYAKAAREYIQTERLKEERAKRDARERREVAEALQGVNQPRQMIVSAETERAVPAPGVITERPSPEEKADIVQALKERIQERASDAAQRTRKTKRWWPLIAGVTVVLVALFMQYNRLIFAPIMAYVSPGNVADDGITAINATVTANPGPEPKLIIPKLNVDVPVHFGISNDEATVMEAMNNGVAQFAIPGANAMPGQIGNLVITGHSAGDIYSNNQYKFIFSGLERLVEGDTIYVNYESKRYTYTVRNLKTVEPEDVQSLVYETDKPMLTLITCTPLGTSRYRLLVTAEQIDPVPDASVRQAEMEVTSQNNESAMPSNSPSFFESIWRWLTGQN